MSAFDSDNSMVVNMMQVSKMNQELIVGCNYGDISYIHSLLAFVRNKALGIHVS
jgi:hypothetical protein